MDLLENTYLNSVKVTVLTVSVTFASLEARQQGHGSVTLYKISVQGN
jgi:hypothetical protein